MVALVALVALVAATGRGLYVSPDAVFYVGTARNWLDGRGFTPPPGLPSIEHFPPLFTLVLAAVGRLGLDPLDAARVVNALAFAGIVVLVGAVVRARTRSVPAATVASVLCAAAVDLLTSSASALSEPLFVLLALSGLVVLAAYLDRRTPVLLVGAAALVSAAFLTRYVGAALVLAGAACLLRRGRDRRWHGALDAGIFGGTAVAPLAVWLVLADGGPSDRSVVVHLFGRDYLGQAARPLSRWLVPWPKPPVGLVLALAVVAAGVVLARRHRRPIRTRSALPSLLVAFAVAYLGLLLSNRALTDATGRLDARFLAPLHVVAIVLVVPALHRRKLPAPALALAGALVLAQVADAVAWTAGGLTDDSVRRRGYTAAALRQSPVIALVGQTDLPVHSNAVDAVLFVTGRTAAPVPPTKDYLSGRVNPRYAEELVALERAGGLLVYLDAVTFRRSFQPSRAELVAVLPMDVVASDAVATVYRLR